MPRRAISLVGPGVWNSTYHMGPTSVIYTVYPWYYYYKLVSNANSIICNIDEAEGVESDKMFLKAQALTFRAYSFFRLVQLYTYPVAISKELIDQIPETDERRYLYLVPTDEEYAECNAAGRSTSKLYNRAKAEYKDRLYFDQSGKLTSLVYAYMQFKFMVGFYPGGGSFPIIRYAEMLYTEAEADMHLGKEDEAKDLLFEAVSQYDAAYTKSEKAGDELMDEIKLYRRFDLWGEGNDWFDYKRWGQSIVRKTREQGGNFKSDFAVTINPEDGNAWTWVIPQKETDYNALVE